MPDQNDKKLARTREISVHVGDAVFRASIGGPRLVFTTMMVFLMVAFASIFFYAADVVVRYLIAYLIPERAHPVQQSVSWLREVSFFPSSSTQWLAYVLVPIGIIVFSFVASKLFQIYQQAREL